MTIRRASSVTTAVAATAPIDPPRAILPGTFPTSLGCACCVVVESCHPKRAVRAAHPRTLTDVLPRLVTYSRPHSPFVAARCVDSSSAAKFRVGSGVTYYRSP